MLIAPTAPSNAQVTAMATATIIGARPVVRPAPVESRPDMVGGNKVTLLIDQSAALPQLKQALEGAKLLIDVAMFSFLPTGSGIEVADILKAQARSGVEVNVEVDDGGSLQIPFTNRVKFFKDMELAGVHVRHNLRNNPVKWPAVDHRKVYVIDNTTSFVGGMNLGKGYDIWHDLMLKLDGPVTARVATEFVGRWRAHDGVVSDLQQQLIDHPSAAVGTANATLLENAPRNAHEITDYYVDQLATAKTRVWMQSPVISSELFVNAMIAAVKRGVDVRLAVTGLGSTNAPAGLPLISRSFYPGLVKAGVKVFEQQRMS
ncbi:MAG: phosphatidylserine/phosphatidylglycerophosphate/cardiolipin synthase family protein, partial [Thermoleophilia bacterium]|nr:phosphatidylserine/phosphatidylglycerophosphate/cardiolipin synthase family protein [Thermoleophilia bacterium]